MAVVITSNGGGKEAFSGYAENLVTAVTTVVATAPDAVTYSLSGGLDAGDFAIDAATGALTFLASPDFEAPADSNKNNVYQVIVKATSGAESDTQTIYITVADGVGVTLTGTEASELFWDASALPDGFPAPDFNTTGDADTIDAGDGDDFINGGGGADAMTGGNGSDWYLVDNAGDTVIEGAGEEGDEDIIYASVSATSAANVEKLILEGTKAINGTGIDGQDDWIEGNDAANVIDGKGGDDMMAGGKGNDTYHVDAEYAPGDIHEPWSGDWVYEEDDAGTDTIISTAESIYLGTYGYTVIDPETELPVEVQYQIENLVLGAGAVSGAGNSLNNVITGNEDDNSLFGLDGNDTLDGGAGEDYMEGGLGDDLYKVDSLGDNTFEDDNGDFSPFPNPAGGIDTVESSISWELLPNIENLTLTGKAAINGAGNGLDNYILGNDAVNELEGKGGNDSLRGGLGADKMTGGTGKDTYYVDDVGDQCIETSGAQVETVYSRVNYTLGNFLEVLELISTGSINGTGNDLDNTIRGNFGANVLTGGKGNDVLSGSDGNDTLNGGEGNDNLIGGDGADTMTGGTGDDSYTVNQTGDVVVENSGEGANDTLISVSSTMDISLTGQFANIEHVTLKADVGKGLDITGNASNNNLTGQYYGNVIKGEGGNDVIDGGSGADEMFGGLGDDTFYVQNIGDQTKEDAGQGTDTVNARGISWTLADNVENLTIIGKSTTNGTGNAENNVMTGNIRSNALSGLGGNDTISGDNGDDTLTGGAGKDSLTGGNGNDRFVFTALTDTTLLSTTTDVIADFVHGEDKINVSAIDADAVTALDQAFSLDANASFSIGEIRQSTVSGNTFLEFNTDADAQAEMSILVTGLVTFVASDFIL